MIIDAHCHGWPRWPYEAGTADRDRGSIERLLSEFDRNGVDHGLVIAARIGAKRPETDNRDNNDYLADAVARYPDRLNLCVDVDSFWDPAHHTDGAADRLAAAVDTAGAVGVTHYSTGPEDGWFDHPEGIRFFEAAARRGLIVSLHTPPDWQPAIGRVATRFPELPILIHHQGHVPTAEDRYEAEVEMLLANAVHPQVLVKVSGYYYLTADRHGYPYPIVQQRLARIRDAYGPRRLLWGSDWPVASKYLTYRQTLGVVREHGDFDDADLSLILGENLRPHLGLS